MIQVSILAFAEYKVHFSGCKYQVIRGMGICLSGFLREIAKNLRTKL